MYQFQALVATGPPALQCLPVQHLFTDISLSFTLKIMFLWLFESFLVVLSYASGNISLPALCGYRYACLTMPAGLISVHWYLHQFCFKNYLFRLLWTLSSRAIICWSNLQPPCPPWLVTQKLPSQHPRHSLNPYSSTHCVVPNIVTPYSWVQGALGTQTIWHTVSVPQIVWFGTL